MICEIITPLGSAKCETKHTLFRSVSLSDLACAFAIPHRSNRCCHARRFCYHATVRAQESVNTRTVALKKGAFGLTGHPPEGPHWEFFVERRYPWSCIEGRYAEAAETYPWHRAADQFERYLSDECLEKAKNVVKKLWPLLVIVRYKDFDPDAGRDDPEIMILNVSLQPVGAVWCGPRR